MNAAQKAKHEEARLRLKARRLVAQDAASALEKKINAKVAELKRAE
jgi:hypothetical protein